MLISFVCFMFMAWGIARWVYHNLAYENYNSIRNVCISYSHSLCIHSIWMMKWITFTHIILHKSVKNSFIQILFHFTHSLTHSLSLITGSHSIDLRIVECANVNYYNCILHWHKYIQARLRWKHTVQSHFEILIQMRERERRRKEKRVSLGFSFWCCCCC